MEYRVANSLGKIVSFVILLLLISLMFFYLDRLQIHEIENDIKKLSHSDLGYSTQAQSRLIKVGPPALPYLYASFTESTQESKTFKSNIIITITNIGSDHCNRDRLLCEKMISWLYQIYQLDNSTVVRKKIISSLAHLPAREAHQKILSIMKAGNDDIKLFALDSILYLLPRKPSIFVTYIINILQNSSLRVFKIKCSSLLKYYTYKKSPENYFKVVSVLIKASKSKDCDVASNSINSLISLNPQITKSFLMNFIPLITSNCRSVRSFAMNIMLNKNSWKYPSIVMKAINVGIEDSHFITRNNVCSFVRRSINNLVRLAVEKNRPLSKSIESCIKRK